MKAIGTFEAKNPLSALLERVEQAEEVLITRHGRPVARLVPPERAHRKTDSVAAVGWLRARAKAANFGPFDWEEWKAYRDEGRR